MTAGVWKGKRVVVLMGGTSKEREISLKTGAAIREGLARLGYDAITLDVEGGVQLVHDLERIQPDVAVVALHGKFGEDGCVQGLLEMLRLPYTGGGVLASSIGMDKVVCKSFARALDIPCPQDLVFDAKRDTIEEIRSRLSFPLPLIVKPSREGSTINMSIVKCPEDLEAAVTQAMASDGKILLEQYIVGKEVTIGLINGLALPALEIAPKSGFYDYSSKYTKGMTDYIVPARIDEGIADKLAEYSVRLAQSMECDGTARVDFIVTPAGEIVFLEINTIPGMTELSLVPKAANYIGIGFDELCERLLDGARLKIS